MGGHDQSDFFSRSLKKCCYGNRFLAKIGILRNVNWHSTTDGGSEHDVRYKTADDSSTFY